MDDVRSTCAVKASLATPLGEMRKREGPHRLCAETDDHTQRDAQASDTLADGTASVRLTVKTVADPKSSLANAPVHRRRAVPPGATSC
jgi:hypothetical protein